MASGVNNITGLVTLAEVNRQDSEMQVLGLDNGTAIY
jgi:hypothetical protein